MSGLGTSPFTFATLLALFALPAPAVAQDAPDESLKERVDRLEQENRDLRVRLDRIDGGGDDPLAAELADLAGPTGRPALAGTRALSFGGYFDLEYRDPADGDRDFRLHRLVPFIEAMPSEHVRFATEIEIEDGHEVEVEFAYLDLLIAAPINFRAGVLLTPLGRFNLRHDSPIQELTDRPLVDRTVIPTTLREAGFGFHGTLAGADAAIGQLSWEAYLTTGFKGLLDDGTAGFDREDGLAEGRAHEELGDEDPFEDNNNSLATVARLEWNPLLGGSLGASIHRGTYDESERNLLTIVAFDAVLDGRLLARSLGLDGAAARIVDGFLLQGEAAHASIETDALARSAGIPDRMQGWYAEVDWRFAPEFLTELAESGWLDHGARFTLVARYDDIDLGGAERERWTFGLNFRPNEAKSVFKFDWQLNRESGTTPAVRNDAFVASVASYF